MTFTLKYIIHKSEKKILSSQRS